MKEMMQLMLVFMLLLLGVASPMNDEGKALMAIKGSFSNVVNMLLDWDDVHNSDFCSWRGVFCDNVSFSVVSLDLQGNKLAGQIPDEIGNCASLVYLGLRGNMLTGTLSSDMCQFTGLWYLDISYNQITGEIPYNIGFLQVATLSLQGNRLTGKIPEVIGLMQALAVLDLSDNELVGPIPPILGNLSFTGKLQLNDNQLVGSIPPELGKLEQLFELDLSGNSFSGSIPLTLGGLEHLLIFDVSFNLLSGVIPTELGQLQNLNSLILNNNKLHGKIPDQLTNCFTLINLFLGNPYLCGNWVGSICGPSLPKSRVFSKAVVICIVLGIITLLCMILIVVVKSKQQKEILKGSSSKQAEVSTKLVVLHMDMAIHTFDDIMRVTENFNKKFIIGYGASSTVYKCTLKTSRPIAIKRLYNQYQDNLREFETELETIGRIRHRNIVSLHGYALSSVGNLLFYDYMENGSLWDLLHGTSKKVKLDWETRLKIAVGAAQGLAYLHHDCTPRIIHRDIKSSNILLDENFVAHLSDFGIAKSIPTSKTHASTYVLGTIGYIDPEYARTSRLNEKSDIYSFGIVLLELLTGKKAVDNESNLHQLILAKADDNTVMEAVDPEVTVTCMDLGHIRKTFKLALLCTKRNPLERPTMLEVSRVLLSLLPSMQVAKKLPSPDPSKKPTNYGVREQQQERSEEGSQWFEQFHEVISKSSV
uniref:Protein kinase domain-containing protein n=1 Tax=Brassica campestris TaxID=3711 RepID=M4D0R8_BRACM